MNDPRPSLRCFVAWPCRRGAVGAVHLVSLEEAERRKREGFAVIGPDPHDEIELAAWIRRNPHREDDGA